MIKNIVFDMGQVLIHWAPDVLIEPYGLAEADKAALKRELFQNVEWVQLDHGTISFEQAVQSVCRRLPEKFHSMVEEIVTGWWLRELVPMEGMAALAAELKAAGYGIYLLSNANTALRDYFGRIPGSECFDGLLVSAEEKLLKPEKAIFLRLCERFGLDAAECFFIDDNPANVEGALCAGMQGTVFYGDAERLRREMKEKGILG